MPGITCAIVIQYAQMFSSAADRSSGKVHSCTCLRSWNTGSLTRMSSGPNASSVRAHQYSPAVGQAEVARHHQHLAAELLHRLTGALEALLGPGRDAHLRALGRQADRQAGATPALAGPGDQHDHAFANDRHCVPLGLRR